MITDTDSATYDEVIAVAQQEAARLRPSQPDLPTQEQLEPYLGKMWAIDRPLIDAVRRHLDEWGVRSQLRSYEGHIEWVAVRAAYAADLECQARGILDTQVRDAIVQRAWRLGLLHDVQAWRGWGPDHSIEGMKAARQILQDVGITDPYLEDQVMLHDKLGVTPRNDPAFDVPYFATFAADHLNWGLEWEEDKWRSLAEKGIPVAKGIRNYGHIVELRDDPNLQQTVWGRDVVVPWVDFGIKVAQHVEQTFSV
ncbi:MAG: hypothetical protein PHG63_00970 [Candidatus Dojkabacteria bacterium]|nr:hypothetical protein [Candidatus Dojkabacteria bacterium]